MPLCLAPDEHVFNRVVLNINCMMRVEFNLMSVSVMLCCGICGHLRKTIGGFCFYRFINMPFTVLYFTEVLMFLRYEGNLLTRAPFA